MVSEQVYARGGKGSGLARELRAGFVQDRDCPSLERSASCGPKTALHLASEAPGSTSCPSRASCSPSVAMASSGRYNIDGARLRLHDPDEAHVVVEPHVGLVMDLAAAVARRGDLDDEIGNGLGVAGVPGVEWESLGRGEGDVRLPHCIGITLQPHTRVGGDERSQASRLGRN